MQPYPTYQNYMYQPYMQPGYQPYADRLTQLQQQTQAGYGQTMQQAPQGIRCEMVDSMDVVKAQRADLSGVVSIYPKTDLSEIYTKQLQPDGTSRILCYQLAGTEKSSEVAKTETKDTLPELIGNLRDDLMKEIEDIKRLIPASVSEAKAAKGVTK